jgi:3-methyladenine DNA glycosylase AlkD
LLSSPQISPAAYVRKLASAFRQAGNPERAGYQRAYMRDQYDYFGLGAKEWMAIVKAFHAEHGLFDGADLKAFVRLCYGEDRRELHYAAITMVEKQLKKQPADFIGFLEEMIVTNAWWDTVDWIAKLVGQHFQRHPGLQHAYCEKWIGGPHMWLQRVAIIHQLAYKEKTDEKLLFDLIRRQADNKEFFIRKACGWALRQYARTRPAAVEKFLAKQPLSGLTVREARKQLDRMKRE